MRIGKKSKMRERERGDLFNIVAVEIIAGLATVDASTFSIDAILAEPEPASGSRTITAGSQFRRPCAPSNAPPRTQKK